MFNRRPSPSTRHSRTRPPAFRSAVLLLGLPLLLAPAARAAVTVSDFDTLPELSGLPSRWQEIRNLFDTPGMAVAVVRNDTIHVATLGFRDPDTRSPVTPKTLFYIASVPDDGVGVFVLVNAGGPAQGLATIAAVDVLERLTGTTSPWSVYDRYVERIRSLKAEGRGPATAPKAAPLPLSAVTRPLGLYEGAFHNPWWGTLTVTRGAAGFAIRLGDYPLDTATVEGEPDAFTAGDAFGERAVGRFPIEPNGTVERVVVSDPERGEIVFER